MRDERNPGRQERTGSMHPQSAMPAMRIVYQHDVDARIQIPSWGEVRVWIVPLDAISTHNERFASVLTPDEQIRADRYKVEKARVQFVTGRGLLRRLLGDCLGVAARAVPIAYTGAGKPVLATGAGDLHFNVTHTDGLALIAIARRQVGIDVERERIVSDPEGLVGRYFSATERESYRALPTAIQTSAFFRGWTSKEAVLKSVGLSVAHLDEFDVELHPERPAALLAARHPALTSNSLQLSAFEPASGYIAALAIEDEKPASREARG